MPIENNVFHNSKLEEDPCTHFKPTPLIYHRITGGSRLEQRVPGAVNAPLTAQIKMTRDVIGFTA